MVHTNPMPSLQGLANMLVMDELLTEETALQAMSEAESQQVPFVNYIVDNKIVKADQLAYHVSRDFGLPMIDLDNYDKESIPLTLVDEELIRRHNALPLFARGDRLFIAVADPSNLDILHEIKFHTGLQTQSIIAEVDKLTRMIENILSAKEEEALDEYLGDSTLDDLEISNEDEGDEKGLGDDAADETPVVRFVNKVIVDAIHKNASDIHFEPYEKTFRVRQRLDGILYEVASPPINLAGRIAARLKVMSQLDISERRIPQDGRFRMKLSKHRSIDFRVSSCPTVNGEKIVMRILDPTITGIGIEALGLNEKQQATFNKHIHQPQGTILVTGPTGSGKTVTLYTALNLLNSPEKNISTAEDPVEIKLPGINQVNINPKTGLTFASTLRSFLRQDPDIIMVGEMRDLETAEIGIKAAQTGHLVLSTLHTNSAPETLTRLINMGISPFNIAGSISLIIAQRLARRLCEDCKTPMELPAGTLEEQGFTKEQIKSATCFQANGCDNCTNGYKGRTGLYEILEITKTMGDIIMNNGTSLDLFTKAREEGMITIREAGIEKVAEGITTLEEINRVTKD